MNAKKTSTDAITDTSQPADDARKPRSDGEQSRLRLLDAAKRLFGEQGFSKTSTREIAQAANANVAAISYYFGDKAGLYQACFDSICPPAEYNIVQFNPPHFTLREALQGYYAQLIAPLLGGEDAEVIIKLFYREMLEPTGLWQNEIDKNIKPEHQALVDVLCRHLGLKKATDDIHRLAYAIVGMGIQILIGRDIVNQITPHMLASPEAIAQWGAYLVDFAEALVNAEKIKLQKGNA